MSVLKMSAICVATLSGMRAMSVAANNELRIVPLPSRTWADSAAVSMRATNAPATFDTRRRVKWVLNCSLASAG